MSVRHEWEELPLPGDAGELSEWAKKQPGMDHGLARAFALEGLNYVVRDRARVFAPPLHRLHTYFDDWERWPANTLRVRCGWGETHSPVFHAYETAWDRFVGEVGPVFSGPDRPGDSIIDAPLPEESVTLVMPVQGVTTSVDVPETALPPALLNRFSDIAASSRHEFWVRMHPAAWKLANRWAKEWRGDYDPEHGWRLRLLKALMQLLPMAVDHDAPKVTSDMVVLARDLVEGCDFVAGYANLMLAEETKVVPIRPSYPPPWERR